MIQPIDIAKEIKGTDVTYMSSYYFAKENKLVRISNHAPKHYNIDNNNEGVNEILLVFVDSNLSENEMQVICDDLSSDLNIDVDYTFFDENDEYMNDVEQLKNTVNRFLNN